MFPVTTKFHPVTSLKLWQQVRHGHGILPHGKPHWLGIAPSKMYLNPPVDHTPDAEVQQFNVLQVRYREHYSALGQYLFEEYLRSSDVGEAAKIQAQLEEEEHVKLLAENEKENARIAKLREARCARHLEEAKKQAAEAKVRFEMEREQKRLAGLKLLEETKEALAHRIEEKDLEKAILTALENPTDPEFAIDKEGHIYRGRTTRSLDVADSEREKIPVPKDETDLLQSRTKQEHSASS